MAAPRKDNVKDLILDTTEKLLENHKLSELSFAMIAASAGISKGTLYYHYKNKNDLLFAIMDKYLTQQMNALLEWTENPEKDTSLHRLIHYVLEGDISNAGMRLHFFYDAMLGNEEVRMRLISRYKTFASIITEKISERTSAVSADYLAWLILLVSDGLFIHQTLHNENLDVQDFIHQSDVLVELLSNLPT